MSNSGICRFETTISIDCSPTTLYERWCDLGSWPTFAEPLTSSLQRTQAMASDDCPAFASSFEPLTMNRIPGELIAWRTMEGAVAPYAAEAWLHSDTEGQRTELQVFMAWQSFLGADHADHRETAYHDPRALISAALTRFKQQMECQ